MPSLPAWASFVEWLLWPLFVLLLLAIIFFTFTMLPNLVAAPFNGFLAEKVEVMVRGQDDSRRSISPNWSPWCRAPCNANCASWATTCRAPWACWC